MCSHVNSDIDPADGNEWYEISKYGINNGINKAISDCIVYKRIKDHSSILYEIYVVSETNSFHYLRNCTGIELVVIGFVLQYCESRFCGEIYGILFFGDAEKPKTLRIWIEESEKAENYGDHPGGED